MLEKHVHERASCGGQPFAHQMKELFGAKMGWHTLVDERIYDDGVEDVLGPRQECCTILDVTGGLVGQREVPPGKCDRLWVDVDDGYGLACAGQHGSTPASDHAHFAGGGLGEQTEDGVHVSGQTHTVTISLALLPAPLPIDVGALDAALHDPDFPELAGGFGERDHRRS